jgi:predicted hotdog family 3-hydroxylacyl-ACP dehydratase
MDDYQVSEQFLRTIDIHELLPQQEPFVMVGQLVHFDITRTVTETTIGSENMFVESGQMTASGLIENIAQTCAARIGYVNKYILKKGIQIGFIGAIRNLEVKALPAVGDTIRTTVDVVEEVFGMILANASIECNGVTMVTTEMKIAIKGS